MLLALALLCLVPATACAQSTNAVEITDFQYLRDNMRRLMHQRILVTGTVTDMRAGAIHGHGDYILQDAYRNEITVSTKQFGGLELYKDYKVLAEVTPDANQDPTLVEVWRRDPVPPPPWALIAAIAFSAIVLLALIIVLIVVIVRKPGSKQEVVDPYDPRMDPGHSSESVQQPRRYEPQDDQPTVPFVGGDQETKFFYGRLLVEEGDGDKGDAHELNYMQVNVGRSRTKCPGRYDIVLKNNTVSRAHAQFLVSNGNMLVQRLPEAQPILVNGEQVESQPLKEGDRIQLGAVTMVLKDLRV